MFGDNDSLYWLIAKCCAPDPADRFASADELRTQLLGVLRETVARRTTGTTLTSAASALESRWWIATSNPAAASSRQIARPMRFAPPVTRAAPRRSPLRAGASVNPAELDEVDRGEDGDKAEDDVEGQHGNAPLARPQ